MDENLWGRSIEGGSLEDPKIPPPEEIFLWTKLTAEKPEEVEIEFKSGSPIAINGKRLSPVEIVGVMNSIAGSHGVGRIDIMEDRILGIKTREIYECPAAVSLIAAHEHLEQLVLTKRELRFKEIAEAIWSELVYAGLWTEPFKSDLDAFMAKTQERVSGKVMLSFKQNSCLVIGRESRHALYSKDIASFDDETFDQRSVEGLLRYHAFQTSLASKNKE